MGVIEASYYRALPFPASCFPLHLEANPSGLFFRVPRTGLACPCLFLELPELSVSEIRILIFRVLSLISWKGLSKLR